VRSTSVDWDNVVLGQLDGSFPAVKTFISVTGHQPIPVPFGDFVELAVLQPDSPDVRVPAILFRVVFCVLARCSVPLFAVSVVVLTFPFQFPFYVVQPPLPLVSTVGGAVLVALLLNALAGRLRVGPVTVYGSLIQHGPVLGFVACVVGAAFFAVFGVVLVRPRQLLFAGLFVPFFVVRGYRGRARFAAATELAVVADLAAPVRVQDTTVFWRARIRFYTLRHVEPSREVWPHPGRIAVLAGAFTFSVYAMP